MFLENKYTKYYLNIIENAKSHNRSKSNDYYELHHIIPKSLGGSNKKDNLILLTAKEHFICHLLLPKMFEKHSVGYNKMLHAIILFKGSNEHQIRYFNSKLYENVKKDYSIIRSKARKNVSLSEEQKQKISNSLKGHSVSQETRQLISEKAKTRVRKPFSDEFKKRQSEIMKSKHRWLNKPSI